MGCFSFLCKVTGMPANSSSSNGSPVHMFLLKNGKVIEHMYGNYDIYGHVFSDKKKTFPGSKHVSYESFEWNMDWSEVCDLMFSYDKSNGIAIVLDPHWKEGDPYPTTRSEDDPNQGWGKGSWPRVKEPYHKVF